jgi:uncharacterized membrane protein HdeD (DUF308 family)
MPSIEDFVGELDEGKKEVSVPKDKVTELSPGWYVSKLNLPHKGSKGSWRNGRFHAHDMGDHYSVHLDRRDPKEHSFGHIIEDAPLLLFLWTGFRYATVSVKDEKSHSAAVDKGLMPSVIIGLGLTVIGLLIAINQIIVLGIIVIAAFLALLVLAAVFIWQGVNKRNQERAWLNFVIGIAAFVLAIVIYYVPSVALGLLVFAMMVWTLGSGLFLIFGRGDKLLFDQSSIAPLIMGVISMVLGIILIFSPFKGLALVISLAGLLLAFIGAMQLISALIILRARRRFN